MCLSEVVCKWKVYQAGQSLYILLRRLFLAAVVVEVVLAAKWLCKSWYSVGSSVPMSFVYSVEAVPSCLGGLGGASPWFTRVLSKKVCSHIS